MSSASLNPSSTALGDGVAPSNNPPSSGQSPTGGARIYRVVWRWHFYAGMLITPPLLVVAITGALYTFKDELEALIYPGVTYVEPAAERVSYERQVAAARAAMPSSRIGLMQVFTNPKRATTLAMFGDKFRYAYVDPYRGEYLGSIEQGGFFDMVLALHRQLFMGMTGRIVVELTTGWTIVLVMTGIYLWWPRSFRQVWGAWLPRLRRPPYLVLRDLHALGGMYLAAIALAIAVTGLYYSYAWGSVFRYAAQKTDAYDMFSKPMPSKSPPDAKEISIDRIVEVARERLPGNNLTVWFPRAPGAVYLVTANNERGPQVNEMLFIDRASGAILEDRLNSQTKNMYWLGSWNYALHVGTIWGMPTKVVWLATCMMLMVAPFTGLWMWWERRPAGTLGLPRRVDARRPRWLIASVIATCLLLPVVGTSVVAVLLGDWLVLRWRKR